MGLGKGFKKAFAERIHGRVRKGRVIIKGKVDSWHLIADGDGSRKAWVWLAREWTVDSKEQTACRSSSRAGGHAFGRAVVPRPRGVQFVCLAKADGVIMRTGVALRMTGWEEEVVIMLGGGDRPR